MHTKHWMLCAKFKKLLQKTERRGIMTSSMRQQKLRKYIVIIRRCFVEVDSFAYALKLCLDAVIKL